MRKKIQLLLFWGETSVHGGATALIASAAVQFLDPFVEEGFRTAAGADFVTQHLLPVRDASEQIRNVDVGS
jgi:hypothetical protein